MARVLKIHVADLLLDEKTLRLYSGQDVPDLERGPDSEDVLWELLSPSYTAGSGLGGMFFNACKGMMFTARARLPKVSGHYVIDDDFAGGSRTARTPVLEASAVRAWKALELYWEAPTGSAVSFRVFDGSDEWWWNGTAWAVATTDDHWSTGQLLQSNIAGLSASSRIIQIVVKLSTDDPEVTPSFYGARLAYGCVEIDAYDDALVRTVLASLRASISATGVIESTAESELASIAVPGDEWTYDVTGVDAAFDQTADPAEETELSGVYADGVWTPDDPIPSGHAYRLEFRYAPHIVVSQHRDIVQVDKLPSVLVLGQSIEDALDGGEDIYIRDLYADPPTALVMPARTHVRRRLNLRVIGELRSDVGRLVDSLRAWFTSAGYRAMLSPASGEVVEVVLVDEFNDTAPDSGGIYEQQATVLLTFWVFPVQDLITTYLVREGGVLTNEVMP